MNTQVSKFFFRVSIFFAFGVILFVILDKIAQTYHPIGGYRMREAINNADKVEAIAVGNSHSGALDFQELNLNGFRIAEGGNDIFEVEYQIKYLVPRLSNIKIVFLNISYFTFHSDNAALPENYSYFDKVKYSELLSKYPNVEKFVIPLDYGNYVLLNTENISAIEKNKLGPAYIEIKNRSLERSSIRKELYNSVNDFNWIKGDLELFIESKISRLIRKDGWRKIFTSMIKGKGRKSITTFDKFGQGNAERFFEHLSADSLCFTAKHIDIPRYIAVTKVMQEYNENVIDDSYNALISIIEFLKSNNIELVLYTPPYSKCFNKYFDKEYINIMNRIMNDIQQKYNIEYFDFSNDSTISKDNTLFFNSDHLNREGAKMFSQKLKNAIYNSNNLSRVANNGM